MNKTASVVAFVCSLVLFVLGFSFIAQSTDRGLERAQFIWADHQNITSDKTDLFGFYLNSATWSFKIEGIAMIVIGVVALYVANSLWKKEK
ncbi:hypothetical protein EJP77_08450 [Paenibacillus zeisoli]|uniref:Uncharacterized protein n=1 Tax=Paenibacillus zeisoli TaxID=2496267 RepID=A0A3S1B9X5_9BACL|nr:hypothetical protein [Paenibacillus zeisoli]RUT33657.1 hypothetical protein EJP77_08450 [Paenibacillus zeisoli]